VAKGGNSPGTTKGVGHVAQCGWIVHAFAYHP
jgi:hypothetical protein